MATVETKVITIAGLELETTVDKRCCWVNTVDCEKLLKLRPNSIREKLQSKSLKAFAGKTFTIGKKTRATGGKDLSMIPVEDFSLFVIWEATRGNPIAAALVTATLAEAVNKRIHAEFGIRKELADYERATKEIYQRLRDEHKIQYKPYVTNWTKLDAPRCHPSYYGKRTNEIKKACGFDTLVSVNEMTTGQLMQWNTIEVRYDSFRRAGLDHKQALAEIASV